MKNLAEVMAGSDPAMEPLREQPAILDSQVAVVLQVAMERVGVIRVGDQPPAVVRLDRLEVDATLLRWTARMDLTKMQMVKLQLMARRRAQLEAAKGKKTA